MGENKLLKHKKGKIRFQQGDFILYEPNAEQKKILLDIINKISNVDNDTVGGTLTLDDSRWVLREITNLKDDVDELSDEMLEDVISNTDSELSDLINAIRDLLIELSEETVKEYLKQVETAVSFFDLVEDNKNVSKLKKKLEKVFNKDKIDKDVYDALTKEGINVDELLEILNKKK